MFLKESTGVPIFFPMVPLKKPRTEWGCQPVIFTRSFRLTPLGRFNRSSILSVLLPARGAVAVFLGPAAVVPGSAFSGAALALRLATRALVVGVAVTFLVFVFEVVILSSFGGSRRVMTLITPSGCTCKSIPENLLE